METQVRNDVDQIIINHAWFATLPGFVPVPVLDTLAIMAVNVDMVKQLANHYNVDFERERGKSIVVAIFNTILGRLPGYAIRSAIKNVPIIGWISGGATMSSFAFLTTYATGRVFEEHFKTGGTLENLNPQSIQQFYQEQFEKGREELKRLLKN